MEMIQIIQAAMADFFAAFKRMESDVNALRKARDSLMKEHDDVRAKLQTSNDALTQARKELREEREKQIKTQALLDNEIDRRRKQNAVLETAAN